MKQISMTQAQLDSWTAQYTGDREGIFYSGDELNVPDDLYPAAAAIDVSIAPSPIQQEKRPSLWAVAYGVTVSDGVIGNIETASAITAAVYIDVGCYWIFLSEATDPALYFPKVFDDATRMKPTEKYADYFVITALDADGNPADPADFAIEIVRLN